MKNNINTEKKLIKEVTEQQSIERKQFEKKMTQEYKLKKERWKREMAVSKNEFLDTLESNINFFTYNKSVSILLMVVQM